MARYAFVVGSNGSAAFGQLRYAADDANRFSDTLADSRYSFKITTASAPTDPYQIKKELDLLAKSCVAADSFVFFFSGHGELLHGELMLVLDETVPGDETTYLPVSWVKEARTRCHADNRLLVLDCCHAGGALGAKAAASPDLTELGLEAKTELMLLASTRLEIAREFEHLKGSFLTTELCKFLQGATSRRVGLGQAMTHLRSAAASHNSAHCKGVPLVPVPFLNGNQQGEFLFSGDITYPDLSAYVTIRSQGQEGSSTSVAMATAMETGLAIRGTRVRLSPRYIREKSRKTGQLWAGGGEQFPPVIFIVEHFGTTLESEWQYEAGRTGRPRGVSWQKLDAKARFRARSFRIVGIEEIETQLALNRPVIVAVQVYKRSGWYNTTKDHPRGLIEAPGPGQNCIGSHCVVIVARTPHGFRFANTWGTDWGDRGFGDMSYTTARELIRSDDIWAVEPR